MPVEKIVVLDGDFPWVRSLFSAMPAQEVRVYLLRVQNVSALLKRRIGWRQLFRWNQISSNVWERYSFVPGWTRFNGLSMQIIMTSCRGVLRSGGRNVIVYTIPHFRDLAKRNKQALNIYYAHDALSLYGWDFDPIVGWQQQIIEDCDAVFAVSRQLELDFQSSKRLVYHSANAVSEEFIDQLLRNTAQSSPSVPTDIAHIRNKIIGCIGQMNHSYDWNFIERVAERLPEVSFVFIGPIPQQPQESEREIRRVLSKDNIYWLGPKEHKALPHYLERFGVCLNPLAVNDPNNRRCPLRLFDYLATDKPVLSTSIREAFEHKAYIEICEGVADAVDLIQKMLNSEYHFDLEARRQYIRENSWRKRAAIFLDRLNQLQQR